MQLCPMSKFVDILKWYLSFERPTLTPPGGRHFCARNTRIVSAPEITDVPRTSIVPRVETIHVVHTEESGRSCVETFPVSFPVPSTFDWDEFWWGQNRSSVKNKTTSGLEANRKCLSNSETARARAPKFLWYTSRIRVYACIKFVVNR